MFKLYSKAVKGKDEFIEYVAQHGFTKEGAKMIAIITYGKKVKIINVAFLIFVNMFVYYIKPSDE